MEEELKYSDNALLNKDIFFDNDINFYIEDTGKEYRYADILKQLFNLKIETVFALDGKNNLKKKYKELKTKKDLRKNFFIADLDFDLLLDKEIIEDQHFIYLEKYEIENYILDEKAFIKFLQHEMCWMETKAEKNLEYNKWITETYNKLNKLFIMYLITQKQNLNLKNTDENPNIYFKEEGSVNISQIDNYYNQLKEELIIIDNDIDLEMKKMNEIVEAKYKNDLSKLIKGKYIIVGIRKYLSYIIGKHTNTKRIVNEKNLLNYLFEFFDKSSLLFIKKQVEYCLTNNL